MLSLELCFLGKLCKHREFIFSPKLNYAQQKYWDNWFGRCHVDNKLTPFLIGKKSSRRIWLFLVKQQNLTYIGLATNSTDLVGRDYPFMLFTVISSENCSQNNLIQLVLFFREQVASFENLVIQGQMDSSLIDTWDICFGQCCDLSVTPKNYNGQIDDNLQELVQILVTNYQNEPNLSNWYDLKSQKIVMYQNTLTCNLYHKIFG